MRATVVLAALCLLAFAAPVAVADTPDLGEVRDGPCVAGTICLRDCIVWFQPPWNQEPYCLV